MVTCPLSNQVGNFITSSRNLGARRTQNCHQPIEVATTPSLEFLFKKKVIKPAHQRLKVKLQQIYYITCQYMKYIPK